MHIQMMKLKTTQKMFYTETIKDKEEDKEDKKKKSKKKKKRKLEELVRSEEVVVEQVRFENTHQIRLFLVFVNILFMNIYIRIE